MGAARALFNGAKIGALGVLALLLWGFVDYLSRRDDFIVRK